MRLLVPAIAVCLLLSSLAGGIVMALTGPQSDPPSPHAPPPAAAPAAATVTPSATAPSAAKASAPASASATSADGDAAAKHAKRTSCVKNAKAKKLVGAQKTAFIKECAAAP